jgi:basic membrane protein A
MKLNKITMAIAAGTVALTVTAAQADIKPAVVYDKAGKFDKSFNEAVFNGIKRFTADTGISVQEVEPTNEAQVEQGLKKLAKRGNSPIVGVGFSQANALSAAAQAYPEAQFTLIDMVVPEANVQSVVFRAQEGSFLVGALAAMKSESDTIGFIGGMDIPLISVFGCGYEQGAKHINPSINVVHSFVGSTGAAFANPSKGSEIARSQFESGADIIFAAAGSSGNGVIQAAADMGKLAIGVDSNQNYLQPGTVLTSMVKRVGEAAYQSYAAAQNGTWKAGFVSMGLAEGGVDWALDEHNRALVTADMEAKVNALKASIIAGDIAVHDYMSDNTCNY